MWFPQNTESRIHTGRWHILPTWLSCCVVMQGWFLVRVAMVVNVVCLIMGALRSDFFRFAAISTTKYSSESSTLPEDLPDNFLVPNIVHYIWYATEPKPFRFHHMLSVLSAHKILQPTVIYFHTNIPPVGEYWDRVSKLESLKVSLALEMRRIKIDLKICFKIFYGFVDLDINSFFKLSDATLTRGHHFIVKMGCFLSVWNIQRKKTIKTGISYLAPL